MQLVQDAAQLRAADGAGPRLVRLVEDTAVVHAALHALLRQLPQAAEARRLRVHAAAAAAHEGRAQVALRHVEQVRVAGLDEARELAE